MTELQVLKERIQILQEEMDAYGKIYQYHYEKKEEAGKKIKELENEQKELEEQRKTLEMTAITQEEIQIVMSQLKQLQVVLTNDIVSKIDLFICGVSISIENECYMTQDKVDKYNRQLHIDIRRTELTEKGLEFSIYLKTNRPVVKDIIKKHINITPYDEYDDYYWSKEEYPTTKFMKDVSIDEML
jgi:DNA repair exonuclease SbcCD ATPase subunit